MKKPKYLDRLDDMIEQFKNLKYDKKMLQMMPGLSDEAIQRIESETSEEEFNKQRKGAIIGLQTFKLMENIGETKLPSPFEKLRKDLHGK